MRLDRNENSTGAGKYALLHLRRARAAMTPEISAAITVLDKAGLIEWGKRGEDDEFFAIKLKDRSAPAALHAYANDAVDYDSEFAYDVSAMATRAERHPGKKQPD